MKTNFLSFINGKKNQISKLGYELFFKNLDVENSITANVVIDIGLIKNSKVVAEARIFGFSYYSKIRPENIESLTNIFDGYNSFLGDFTTHIFDLSKTGKVELNYNVCKVLGKCERVVDNFYFIDMVRVNPEYQKLGIGKLLIGTVVDIINSNDEDNLITCYPYPIEKYSYSEHRGILTFWHKIKFSQIHKQTPMFFYNSANHKYQPEVIDEIIYKQKCKNFKKQIITEQKLKK